MLETLGIKQKKLIKTAPSSFNIFLCKSLLNVVNVYVPVKKKLLQGHEKNLKKGHLKNFYPPGPSAFYLPPAKAVISRFSKERERTLYAAANVRDIGNKTKKLIKTAPSSFNIFLCKSLLNVVNVYVPVKEKLLQGHEKYLKKVI